jgi:hypothetical protein
MVRSYATPKINEAHGFGYQRVVDEICNLNWENLNADNLINVAWAYYYFSIQFRENLEIARSIIPDDERLKDLDRGERNTDNLSPWPGVATVGEKMHHDEFMRRTLALTEIPGTRQDLLKDLGQSYLVKVRSADDMTRAVSLASYEDGGLEAVFKSILRAPEWDNDLLAAFRHFLVKHIEFDSDPVAGHGALCRHLTPDDRILPLWIGFRELLCDAAPDLTQKA